MQENKIDAKIEEIKRENLVATSAYFSLKLQDKQHIDIIHKWEGWLVGLGMAKGMVNSDTSISMDENFISHLLVEYSTKTSPYEIGIKEALEWARKEMEK